MMTSTWQHLSPISSSHEAQPDASLLERCSPALVSLCVASPTTLRSVSLWLGCSSHLNSNHLHLLNYTHLLFYAAGDENLQHKRPCSPPIHCQIAVSALGVQLMVDGCFQCWLSVSVCDFLIGFPPKFWYSTVHSTHLHSCLPQLLQCLPAHVSSPALGKTSLLSPPPVQTTINHLSSSHMPLCVMRLGCSATLLHPNLLTLTAYVIHIHVNYVSVEEDGPKIHHQAS